MNLTPDKPTARDLLDRCRILTHSMLEIDEHGPNYVLLLILADQLHLLYEAFKEAEELEMRREKLPE
ncbi:MULTISPECIES: hypothetical protein [Enterobacteriaceae]|nr:MULTISPECIES: hypothetical protein [Enterobacteriaceae]EDT6760932.1 hypothetical protein [Salmonella enterica subsp. enterica]EKW3300393.1 hypothetical protein [Klebsiella oxytoca]HBI5635799.1 hypothetical protein [Salmonella enterica subsp. enterica serovar Welikade]HCM1953894.1 hypothetical protein [Salmonella enterica subsp. salamae serovar 9,46:z4,z24:z39:z42]HCM9700124.1 hypothetical protein [Enterobacter hormaechei subsp. xiangfangensis]HDR2846263.1 hypothetical protein [Enterobacter